MEDLFIDPQAIINEGAKIASDVKVGPFSIIGPNVEIEEGTIIHSHVVIDGFTKIGKNNQIYPFSSIGLPPQDLTYKGEPTKVIIGDNNTIREYVSIHRATTKENGETIIGNSNFLMDYVHIGHDVILGDNCIIANTVNFAGHVRVGDGVIIGGGTNIRQFCSLGTGSYIGGASAIDRDIPHFCTAVGNRIRLKGINIIGLRRRGYSKKDISEVVDFFRSMENSNLSPRSFISREERMSEYLSNEIIQKMADCILKSDVGIAPFNY